MYMSLVFIVIMTLFFFKKRFKQPAAKMQHFSSSGN